MVTAGSTGAESKARAAAAAPQEVLAPPEAREAIATKSWTYLLRGVRRLAHVRRIWGLLGGHLRAIKERGQK